MPDARFFLTNGPAPVDEAARIAGAALSPGAKGSIDRAASLDDDDLSGAVVFIENRDAAAKLAGRVVGLALATPALASALSAAGPVGVMAVPRLGFARIAGRLHAEHPFPVAAGVDPSAEIGEGARVHETAVIAAGATIGGGAVIDAYAVIGPGVVIGAESRIGAGATIAHCIMGARAAILPGARIGQAGFGFVAGPDGPMRVPQLGRVMIGDDVEIGANTTIDRGALGDTAIGDGVKIDNLVQIGHNVRIGRFAILAAHVGVSGSTVIGEGALLGGKVGIADHVTIGDGAQIAAGAGVMRDIGPGEKWGGLPARPFRTWFRETATLAKLASKKKTEDDGD